MLRSYLVGHSLSITDIIMYAAIRANKVAIAGLKTMGQNVVRWFSYIENANSWIPDIISWLIQSSRLPNEKKDTANFNIDVETTPPWTTRFPPEPSGLSTGVMSRPSFSMSSLLDNILGAS